MEDRSALFNQLKNFSQRKLKKVETKVVTSSGEQLVEKRGAKGLQVLTSSEGAKNQEAEPARKLDLQVGLVLPGFLIGSQDVAHDKSSLDSYGVTHILNLDNEIENKYEDDYNYKNINIQDRPDFVLDNIFEDCFDFIDDGRHYGNVLVHCSGTIGLSRSTSICIAYLMNKEKQKFDEAFNNVKEARSFVKPSEGFLKQLKEYEVKLRGAQEIKESGIDDPFALRKKQEIEKEKAMVAGAASVKNRMKMFGATLDTNANSSNRSKSVSPSPAKIAQQQQANSPAVSKWGGNNRDESNTSSKIQTSKSMTPEPRKSWQVSQSPMQEPDWRSNKNSSNSNLSNNSAAYPPPPPPPLPPVGLLKDNKSNKSLPPPPPPPPPSDDLLKGSSKAQSTTPKPPTYNTSSSRSYQEQRKKSIDSQSSDTSRNYDSNNDSGNKRMVFGRVPPPPMKIKGGLSIERHDATSEANLGFTKSTPHSANVESYNSSSNNYNNNIYGLRNGSNTFGMENSALSNSDQYSRSLQNRCESPLVLMNNVPPQFDAGSIRRLRSPQPRLVEDRQSFFETNSKKQANDFGQLPKRTVSLGPRRQQQQQQQQQQHQQKQLDETIATSGFNNPSRFQRQDSRERAHSFNRMADALQSSLTELNNLIDTPQTPKIASEKPPKFTSYLTKTSDESEPKNTQVNFVKEATTTVAPDSPEAEQTVFDWRADLMNWKASTSMNDLRSMFESKPKDGPNLNLPPAQSSATLRPPRSASPNFLKNSPWQNLVVTPNPSTQPSASNTNLNVYPKSDYTIRRTTSTQHRSNVPRNPYRSHYGQY